MATCLWKTLAYFLLLFWRFELRWRHFLLICLWTLNMLWKGHIEVRFAKFWCTCKSCVFFVFAEDVSKQDGGALKRFDSTHVTPRRVRIIRIFWRLAALFKFFLTLPDKMAACQTILTLSRWHFRNKGRTLTRVLRTSAEDCNRTHPLRWRLLLWSTKAALPRNTAAKLRNARAWVPASLARLPSTNKRTSNVH